MSDEIKGCCGPRAEFEISGEGLRRERAELQFYDALSAIARLPDDRAEAIMDAVDRCIRRLNHLGHRDNAKAVRLLAAHLEYGRVFARRNP